MCKLSEVIGDKLTTSLQRCMTITTVQTLCMTLYQIGDIEGNVECVVDKAGTVAPPRGSAERTVRGSPTTLSDGLRVPSDPVTGIGATTALKLHSHVQNNFAVLTSALPWSVRSAQQH